MATNAATAAGASMATGAATATAAATSSALILFGLSYEERHRGGFAIDYRFSVPNYRKMLWRGFLDRGEVDVFLCTRNSSAAATATLLRTYAPRRHLLLGDDELPALPRDHVRCASSSVAASDACRARISRAQGMHHRNLRLVAAIELCLGYAASEQRRGRPPYGLVLLTRFDLYFTLPLRYLNVDPSLVNVAARLAPYPMVDDNLYVLPFSLLRRFRDVVALRNISAANPKGGHLLKRAIEHDVKAPLHLVMDQGPDLPFWNASILTPVRCVRPHHLLRPCQPAGAQVATRAASRPKELDVALYDTWAAVQGVKRGMLGALLESERKRCEALRPFRTAEEGPSPPPSPLAAGQRVLIAGARTRRTKALDGAIAQVVGALKSGLAPVQVLSPPLLAESDEGRPATWMFPPRTLRRGAGATPEELRWCELNRALPTRTTTDGGAPPLPPSEGATPCTWTDEGCMALPSHHHHPDHLRGKSGKRRGAGRAAPSPLASARPLLWTERDASWARGARCTTVTVDVGAGVFGCA